MTYATQWLKRIKTAGSRAVLREHDYKPATRPINGDIRFATD